MKQLAVRSLGWGIGALGLIPLPALAAIPLPNTASPGLPFQASSLQATQQSSPQLLAVALSSRRLSLGDRGADVRILQRYLSRNGLYSSVIDGIYGQETADAVATYQRIRDLPATGIADEDTLTDMEFDFLPDSNTAVAAAPAATRQPASSLLSNNLSSGDTGSDVIALQQQLNNFGIPVFVDGVYGFETQQAVRTYQRVQGLPVTGTADSETLEAMGFSTPNFPYVAAVIADESQLATIQRFFPNAFLDRQRQGRFINIGSFADRSPAEARVDAAAARGFTTRVLYRRNGLFR